MAMRAVLVAGGCATAYASDFPSSITREVEKLACGYVEQKFPASVVAEDVCHDLKAKVKFLPETTCESFVNKVYAEVASECPSDTILGETAEQAAIPPAISRGLEEVVCGFFEKKFPEGTVSTEVCQKLKSKVKFMPEAPCETFVEKIYDFLESKCPAAQEVGLRTQLPSGFKHEVEKLACGFVEKKFPEEVVAKDVCSDLKTRIHFLPEAPCESFIEKVYSGVVSKCPADELESLLPSIDATLFPPSITKEMEKLACGLLQKKFPEGRVATEVCEELKSKVKFLPEAPCEQLVDKVYSYMDAKCPAHQDEELAAQSVSFPSGLEREMEKLACGFVEKKFPEGTVAKDVCSELKAKIHFLPEAPCESFIEKIYSGVVSKCPSGELESPLAQIDEALLPPAITKELEKLACRLLEKKFPEGKVATEVCDELKSKVKFLPEAPCEALVDKVYSFMDSKCPRQEEPVNASLVEPFVDTRISGFPSKLERGLEKLACGYVEKQYPMATVARDVCRDLKSKIKFLPEAPCESFVDKIYSGAVAKCPKSDVADLAGELEAASLPPTIEKGLKKMACKFLEGKFPENAAATDICTELKAKVKFLPEAPCENIVEKVYNYFESKCPAEEQAAAVVIV